MNPAGQCAILDLQQSERMPCDRGSRLGDLRRKALPLSMTDLRKVKPSTSQHLVGNIIPMMLSVTGRYLQ